MSKKRYLQISDLASTKTSIGWLPVSPTTCWRMVKRGVLPQPFKLGPGTTIWDAEEVQFAIDALKAKRGKND